MKTITAGMLLTTSLSLFNCGLFDDSGNNGRIIQNKARLENATTLNLGLLKTGSVLSSLASIDVVNGVSRSTPVNLQGDLCYAFLSLGELGPGMFPMTWLAPASTFPNGPHEGTCSTVQFDLNAPQTITGQLLIPKSADNMPSAQKIIRAELSFNYVDATFEAGDSNQLVTIRTVYATTATALDVLDTMLSGDKLIRLPGDTVFQWANAAGLSPHRNSVVSGILQDTTVTNYDHPNDGNADYIPVTANFLQEVDVDYALLADTSKTWTLAFDLTHAIVWSQDPQALTTPQQILGAFRLKFGPNQSTTYGEEDDGIRSTLSIE